MADQTGRTITKLKEIVDRESRNYLADEPYKVFTELTESGAADKKTAGAVLLVLLNGIQKRLDEDYSPEELSWIIQKECCLNKEMADEVSIILLSLYTFQNREEWKNMDLQGLEQFKREEFTCTWEGFSVWRYSSGSVSCHYEADITLRPTEAIVVDPELAELLRRNPFMTKESIREHYRKELTEYLDRDFDDYCTCDDYYQPVVEDYLDDRDAVREWCKKNGFELIECEGDGWDNGYEPDVMRGGYW